MFFIYRLYLCNTASRLRTVGTQVNQVERGEIVKRTMSYQPNTQEDKYVPKVKESG